MLSGYFSFHFMVIEKLIYSLWSGLIGCRAVEDRRVLSYIIVVMKFTAAVRAFSFHLYGYRSNLIVYRTVQRVLSLGHCRD